MEKFFHVYYLGNKRTGFLTSRWDASSSQATIYTAGWREKTVKFPVQGNKAMTGPGLESPSSHLKPGDPNSTPTRLEDEVSSTYP